MQIEVACEATRNTERPHKPGFGLGFLPGQEVIWLSEALRIVREEASDVDVTIMTKSSPELANALMQGEIDVALMRTRDADCWPGFQSSRQGAPDRDPAFSPSSGATQVSTARGHLSRGLYQHSRCRPRA